MWVLLIVFFRKSIGFSKKTIPGQASTKDFEVLAKRLMHFVPLSQNYGLVVVIVLKEGFVGSSSSVFNVCGHS